MKKRTLSEIWIYPIKSLGGIRLKQATVLPKGLKYDRRWMLIDTDNQFITQRVHSRMSLFKLAITDTHLQVTFREHSLDIPLSHALLPQPVVARVWDDTVTVFEVSSVFSDWFSLHLGIPCRLVAFPEENPRPVDPLYKIADDHVSLADAYPLLVIGQASLDDLNMRLDEPVPMNRFRPNLVFTGGTPYEEDTWREFKIGKNILAGVKPCARCVLTTVNQETGEKGKEPLATLSRYRRRGEKVLFGQNVIAIECDEIHEGDELSF